MQVTQVGAAFAVADPSTAGTWFDNMLGFRVLVDLDWYVSTVHPDHPKLRVDFVRSDHDTWAEPSAAVRGTMLALEVPDVDDQHERLVAGGASIIKPPVTEPWGQRRVQVAGPEGLVIELVQAVEPDPEWMASQNLSV